MKKIILLSVCLLMISNLLAQKTIKENCGTDYLHLKLLNENAEYRRKFDNSNNEWQKYAKKHVTNSENRSIIDGDITTTLNIVFHDMTNTTLANSATYLTAVQNLNNKFIPTGINFCLATRQLNGDVYNDGSGGNLNTFYHSCNISNLDKSLDAQIESVVQQSHSQENEHFPSSKYINIYVVSNIVGDTAGFAYLPSSHGDLTDGIFIEQSWLMGDTSDINVFVHEMGHYLGLFHVFGICNPDNTIEPTATSCSCDNGNPLFNGDMVADTPPSMLNNNTCDLTLDTCPASAGTDLKDNYMDYSLITCQDHFTAGQITRMQFMINPITGVRKSLIGENACTDCSTMNNCTFEINASPILSGIRHEVLQTSTGTPPINFTPQVSCGLTTIEYTWTLTQLGSTNSDFPTETGATFTLSQGLTPGNYQLSMTATNSTNHNCFETDTYTFVILPFTPPGSCDAVLPIPVNNNVLNWGTSWERVSYRDRWTRNTSDPFHLVNGANRFMETDSGFDNLGFDIISPATVNNPAYDPNFPTAVLPVTANISSVFRVGRIVGGNGTIPPGNAYYANVKFHPTPNNCRFRIYYLGLKGAINNDGVTLYSVPQAFNLQSNSNSTAFGFVSQYRYNSPAASGTNLNSIIGLSENGILAPATNPGDFIVGSSRYGLNDMISIKHHDNGIYNTIGTNNVMSQWAFYDLDFSEFVNLSPDTEITITFFSHSNDAINALNSSYAYFGIECLGSGTPQHLVFDLEDNGNISVPCQYPASQSCAEIDIPRPNYIIPGIETEGRFEWLNQSNNSNYARINVSRWNGTAFIPEPSVVNSVIPALDENFVDYRLKLCLSQSDAPFEDFRIEYITLHETFIRTVRVFSGFYHDNPICSNTTYLGGAIQSGMPKSYTIPFLENGQCLQNINLNTLEIPCFADSNTVNNFDYQWFNGSTQIFGATGLTYQVTPADFGNHFDCKKTFKRKVRYVDPYCQVSDWKDSESYTVYDLNSFNQFSFNVSPISDICAGYANTTTTININNLAYDNSCKDPNLTLIANPQVSVQLFVNLGGNEINIGDITNFIVNVNNGIITLSTLANPNNSNISIAFNNVTSNGQLILPVGTHGIRLRYFVNLFGCPLTIDYPIAIGSITVRSSAVGGQIAYNCINNSVVSNPLIPGVSNLNQFGWEIASNPGGPYTLLSSFTSNANLTSTDLSTITTFPYFLRRVAYGFGSCELNQFSNEITITAPAVAPTVTTPITYFINSTATPLTATGNNLLWYTTSTGGIGSNIAPTPNTSVLGTTSYYVSQIINGCESPRAEIVINVINSCTDTSTWNGTSWNNGTPTLSTYVVITGDYDMTSPINLDSFDACRVRVVSPAKVTVDADKYVNIDHELVVEPGAAFEVRDNGSLFQIDDTGINTGNITYKRFVDLRKFDYVYWSSPISSFVLNNLPNSLKYKWDPSATNINSGNYFPNYTGNWVGVGNTEIMEIGRGYILRPPTSYDVTNFTQYEGVFNNGIPNNGILSSLVSRGGFIGPNTTAANGAAITNWDDNFNLIGNPYPSAIDARRFLLDHDSILEGYVAIWTHGTTPSNTIPNPFYGTYSVNYTSADYLLWNGTGLLNGPINPVTGQTPVFAFNGNIAAGQGFMVSMLDGTANASENITFNNRMRYEFANQNQPLIDNTDFFRNSANQSNDVNRIWLDIVNSNNLSVRTLVGYVEGATLAKDNFYDLHTKVDSNLGIYSIVDNENVSIQGRPLPFNINDEVTLGISIPTEGIYKFGLYALQGIFDQSQNVYIEDTLLNIFHNIKTSPYTFTSQAGRFENRFKLVYIAPNTTQLTSSQCNTILPALNTIIYANLVPNAQSYNWIIKNNETNITHSFTTTGRSFQLTNASLGFPTNFVKFGSTYTISVRVKLNDVYQAFGNECVVTTPNIPITQIQCPSGSLPTINSYINANINNYATAYRFEVKNLTTNQVGHIDRSLRNFMLTSITDVAPSSLTPFAMYNTQYSVKVALLVNGDQGDYSEECIVTTPNIPITQIQCPSGSLPTINSYINANINNYATAYRFEVKNLTTNQVGHIDRSLRNFMLTSITDVTPSSSNTFATFNTQYSVKVALLVNGDQGDYSEECIVTTPNIPITQIQCPSGPLPTINSYINANINNYATAYRFEVKNLTTNQVGHIDRSLRNFMLTSITNVVPSSSNAFATYNTQYSVKVALLVNGDQGDYSEECIIETPSTYSKTNNYVSSDFKAVPIPNPFSNEFSIQIKSNSDELITIKVYDMIGKLLDNYVAKTENIGELHFGRNYPAGFYNIIITQGNNVEKLKIIKK